jgi:L,D-peptidoglycan transpeptidase YkuD (ErfK/YbiS/YcfS/YnhG family)
LVGTTIGFILFVAAAFFLPGPQPPTVSFEKAKMALNKATAAGALRHAETSYRSAEALMRTGWMEMARQDGRLPLFRNYKAADSLLNLAAETALRADRQARQNVSQLDSLARSQYAELKSELSAWREALNGSLAKFKAENHLSSAQLSLETAELLIREGEYQEAGEAVVKGRESLGQLAEMLTQYANDEVQKIEIWRRWVQETLAESSKSGTYSIIVDKSAHKTYLVKSGKLIKTYDCELGYNSSHNKLFSGDGATPEGKYRITVVKPRGSRYYKALLLDYPNPSDKKRFKENMEKGIISSRSHIGGLIEIHGDGGKGSDWTEGCVALINSDMDHLMKYVTVGTSVTIVRRSDQWP